MFHLKVQHTKMKFDRYSHNTPKSDWVDKIKFWVKRNFKTNSTYSYNMLYDYLLSYKDRFGFIEHNKIVKKFKLKGLDSQGEFQERVAIKIKHNLQNVIVDFNAFTSSPYVALSHKNKSSGWNIVIITINIFCFDCFRNKHVKIEFSDPEAFTKARKYLKYGYNNAQ